MKKQPATQQSFAFILYEKGQLPEWPNGADCNSAGLRLRWFESITAHLFHVASLAQLARARDL